MYKVRLDFVKKKKKKKWYNLTISILVYSSFAKSTQWPDAMKCPRGNNLASSFIKNIRWIVCKQEKIHEPRGWTRRIQKFLRITRGSCGWIRSMRVPFEFWMIPETTAVTIGIGTHGSVRLHIPYSRPIRPINHRRVSYTGSPLSFL